MKIELDQQEIVAILVNWAKVKYGTHNIAVDKLESSARYGICANLSITMSENDFGEGASKINAEKFGELVKQMKFKGDVVPASNEPELPNYDNVTLGAI